MVTAPGDPTIEDGALHTTLISIRRGKILR
jgi:hypothetical protein